jgi:hypothetical protein
VQVADTTTTLLVRTRLRNVKNTREASIYGGVASSGRGRCK